MGGEIVSRNEVFCYTGPKGAGGSPVGGCNDGVPYSRDMVDVEEAGIGEVSEMGGLLGCSLHEVK